MKIFVCAGVCLATLVAAASVANAQTATGGIKIGVTSANILATGLPGFDSSAKPGLTFGAWINGGRGVARIQIEAAFSWRRFSSPSPEGTIDASSRGVEVPMLLMARLRPEGRAHLLIFGGPYVAIITKATQTVLGHTTDLDSLLKKVDAGLVAGVGVEVGARRAVVLDARMLFGTRNLSKASDVTLKSRTLVVSFGCRF